MSVVEAIVIGVVQGLTEFIPVSSSGHLVLVPEVFGWDSPGLAYDVLLHTASLIALLVYFAGDLLDLVRGAAGGSPDSRRFLGVLAVGTIPVGIAGLTLGDFFSGRFEDPPGAALSLLLTATILVVGERVLARRERKAAETGARLRSVGEVRYRDGLAIGFAQALALLPGVSRSGSTISAGLIIGIRRQDAARFAFLLAIPALVGASLVEVPKLTGMEIGIGAATAGFVASLVASYVAIAALIRHLKTRTLYPFALYCFAASAIFSILVA